MTKTTYTATVQCPVYAAWKCLKCRTVNLSNGAMVCRREKEVVNTLSPSRHREVEETAQSLAAEEWAPEMLACMTDPRNNAFNLRHNLIMSAKCKTCGAKAKWNKGSADLDFLRLMIGAVILSGMIALLMLTNILAWVIFAMTVGVLAAFCIRNGYERMIKKTPQEYLPVFGTPNEELIAYAAACGVTFPTPEEAIVAVADGQTAGCD